ncbi:MAG: trypsin-like peptidase domain-containing protein, partial [Bacteroidota bacterium]
MKLKPLNLLLGMALLVLGIFIGGAWKNSTNEATDDTAAVVQKERSESAISVTPASNSILPDRLNQGEESTIRLFEEAAPSVVFITTTSFRRDYFNRNVTEIPSGTGSGFVWDKAGHIITNYHVIQSVIKQNGGGISVTFYDQSTWDAEIIGTAPEKDLAVLKIDAPTDLLRPIPVGISEILRVGQSTYAIGNPFGLDQTLTTGIVSALGREIESVGGVQIRDVIQTDAAINPGNSGGPLLNSSGELIGVNTAIYSPSGAYAGIGFSIPVDAVKLAVPDLIQYGQINRPTLGIYPYNQQSSRIEGVLIMGIAEGGGAEQAGLQPTYRDRYGRITLGDIIVGIDNKKIASYSDLILTLEEYKPGDRVSVSILRDEQEVAVDVVLGTG